MLKIIISHNLLILALIISGIYSCATKTEKKLEKELDALVGSEITIIVDQWGLPIKMDSRSDGTTYYVWYFDEGTHIVHKGAITESEHIYCKVIFTVKEKGIIDSWSTKGNNCKM